MAESLQPCVEGSRTQKLPFYVPTFGVEDTSVLFTPMNTSFLTSLSEQELKAFLKSAIRDILQEQLYLEKPKLPDILNIGEAAAFLKLRINTLYEKTSRKLIPHFKKGNKLYFNREELEDWIRTGKVKTIQELGDTAATFLLSPKRKSNRRHHP